MSTKTIAVNTYTKKLFKPRLRKIMITEILQYILGSRTEQCPECSDYVMLKEWEKVSVKENSFLFKFTI